MAAATSLNHEFFNNPGFVKMYKTVEQVTGHYGRELIHRSSVKQDIAALDKLVVLDLACGTGVVSEHLMDLTDDSTISKIDLTCADFADAMLNAMKERVQSKGWPHAKVVKADAQDTKLPSSQFTHIFFSFGPMLLPDPDASMKECYRMLGPGGVLGTNTWETLGWYPAFKAGLETNSTLPTLPTPEAFVAGLGRTQEKWWNPDSIRGYFESNGFKEVKVETVAHSTSLSLEETLLIVPSVLNIVYKSFWSEEQQKDDGLKEEAVKAVEGYIRDKYSGGTVDWDWVAICALGRK